MKDSLNKACSEFFKTYSLHNQDCRDYLDKKTTLYENIENQEIELLKRIDSNLKKVREALDQNDKYFKALEKMQERKMNLSVEEGCICINQQS